MISFIKSGLMTTVQDGGRTGYQRFGMPTAGAMDRYAMYLANILVGNDMDAAVLEATVSGPKLLFQTGCAFAITGADMKARLDGMPVEPNRAYSAQKGSLLELRYAMSGCRSYIAFAGGLAVQSVMGSCSTYTKAKIGGIDGRRANDGDTIKLLSPKKTLKNMALRHAGGALIPAYGSGVTLRVTLGPQQDRFTEAGLAALFSEEYTVTSESDRMGCRLMGKELELEGNKTADIVSDAVAFGSVQAPNGRPIIMMADHQTTGGYAKPCCVITADIPLAAQLKPGNKVRFMPISVEQAQSIHLEHMKRLKAFSDMIEHGFLLKHRPLLMHLAGRSLNIQVNEVLKT